MRAMSYRCIPRTMNIADDSALDIHLSRDGFQMVGIDTAADAAKVINI